MITELQNQRWLLTLALLSLGLLAITGCSSDDDPTAPGGTDEAPAFAIGGDQTVDLPTTLEESSDPIAQAIVGFMTQVNTLSAMGGTFAVPPGATESKNKDNTWTYTWTVTEGAANLTVVMVVTETDDSYSWALSFNGTDGEGTYNDFLIYRAEQAKDDSWGSFVFYDFGGDPEDVIFRWDWATDDLGVFTMTMVGGSGVEAARTVFVVMPTGAGSLDIEEWGGSDWIPVLHYDWNTMGTGSYAIYEDGELIESGTWGGPA